MFARLRRWMPLLKILFTLAVLAGVGWFFARILWDGETRRALWDQTCAHPAGLAAAALLYLLGMAFPALFWLGLLWAASDPAPLGSGFRAYYLSHLGKYTVGMGLPTVMRMSMAAAAGVRPGTAALTAAYETLTTMSAGALLAAVLIAFQAETAVDPTLFWKALGLLVLAGVPILPGVFNFLVRRLSARFTGGQPLPRLPAVALPIGLVVTAFGWALYGVSLAAVLHALREQSSPWSVGEWLDCTAITALAYVAGFVSSTPGGLGVRELLLQQFLAPRLGGADGGDARAVVAALLLRVLWTAAELAAAGVLYWIPTGNAKKRRMKDGEQGTGNESVRKSPALESGP